VQEYWDLYVVPVNQGVEQVAIMENRPTNLVNQYGLIPIPSVRAHAETYMDQEVRAAQDAAMLNIAIQNSIDKVHLAILDNRKEQWHVNGNPNGPLAYATLMSVCTSAVNLCVEAANHLLADAPSIMKNCDGDISKFCEEIRRLRNEIFVLGHTPRDLIESIFAAFNQVQEPGFISYIVPLRHKYYQGKLTDNYATIRSPLPYSQGKG
jgi:hypothetical protein